MPGPLPNPQRKRRNAPTIPTANLPAAGREGDIPTCPYVLGDPGARWWAWAWALPQAAAWSDGDLYVVARRASLEDDIDALARVDGLDALDLLEVEKATEFKQFIQRLAALATGRMGLAKEMRELDDRLGLTPKAMAAMRWTIAADAAPEVKAPVRALRSVSDPRVALG